MSQTDSASQSDSINQGNLPPLQSEIPPRPAWFQSTQDGHSRSDSAGNDPPKASSWLWLSQWDVLVCVGLAAAILSIVAFDWIATGRPADAPPTLERTGRTGPIYRIDINRAGWVEFAQLEGIGPAIARRIVEDRLRHGPFTGVDDLSRVKGIGPKTLQSIRPFVRVIRRPAAPRRAASRR